MRWIDSFDTIETLDILDCNGGDHGYPFATNFNPEINIRFKGQKIVPIEFLKALLPDPASLGPRTKGKTNIGCIFHGMKDGKTVDYYVYNVCDHQECYAEVGSQAISYTTGVPAMIGAKMFLEGKWTEKGVHTCEEFDPDPFMAELNVQGLPWKETFDPIKVP